MGACTRRISADSIGTKATSLATDRSVPAAWCMPSPQACLTHLKPLDLRVADRMAEKCLPQCSLLDAEPRRLDVALDAPCASERVELVPDVERMVALADVVERAPVRIAELQCVVEHSSFIGRSDTVLKGQHG